MSLRVACLAWGSLVWDPRDLKSALATDWRTDGPMLPLEFARTSDSGRGRLTLVIVDGARPVPALWAEMCASDVNAAREIMRIREGCPLKSVGSWPSDEYYGLGYDAIDAWARQKGLDHVVWTALGPLFDGKSGFPPPSSMAAIAYLRSRSAEVVRRAEEYVRKAPSQIRTDFRIAFENELGWLPAANSDGKAV